MQGTTDLRILLKELRPELQQGEFVFGIVDDISKIDPKEIIGLFKEKEGHTIIVSRNYADLIKLTYTFVAAWITFTVHSALEATGLTAAFSTALAKAGASCNVVAGYYHDHIFVNANKAEAAIVVLRSLSC